MVGKIMMDSYLSWPRYPTLAEAKIFLT